MNRTKTAKATLIAAAIVMLALTAAAEKETAKKVSWFRSVFAELSWNEVTTVVKNPQDAARRVKMHVEYAEDFGDTWSAAADTWKSGTGDCEDFAACVVALCKANGFDAEIMVFYPKGQWEAHAVVTGQWKGKTWISSNGSFQWVRSIEQAKYEIAKQQGWPKANVLVTDWNEFTSEDPMIAASGKDLPIVASR